MSFCAKCLSTRIVSVNGKVSDMFSADHLDNSYQGYVPVDLGIGEGDYIYFSFCLNCGHIDGKWPAPQADIEKPQ